MARTLNYTKRDLNQIRPAFDYLYENFGTQASDNLIQNIENKEKILLNYPETGRPTGINENIKYTLIDDNKRLYYRYNSKSITIHALFDARQDPNKRPY